jgi:pimeloyl-ACP methyl ester carboxylesterase
MKAWVLGKTYEYSQGIVRYDVTGSGPPIILVHGTPWSSYTWHKLIPVLAQSYTVYYYDYIGYGLSEKAEGQDVSLASQGRLLTELINHWKLDSPGVVAHDFGGATSLRSHLLDGCDFAKLILLNVVAISPWGSPFFSHIQKHERAFAGVPAYIHEAIVRAYIQGAIYNPLAPEVMEMLVKPWLGEMNQDAFYRQIAQASQTHTDELESQFRELRCPVQILWGAMDNWIPVAVGRKLQEKLPEALFTIVENAGHLVQLDAAEVVREFIVEYME